jgi:hypothetical protein
MAMNKKTQANKQRAKTKPAPASNITNSGRVSKNVIDARSQESAAQEGMPCYDADEGPIDKEYFEWMQEQAKSQMSAGEVVFGKSLFDLENSGEL